MNYYIEYNGERYGWENDVNIKIGQREMPWPVWMAYFVKIAGRMVLLCLVCSILSSLFRYLELHSIFRTLFATVPCICFITEGFFKLFLMTACNCRYISKNKEEVQTHYEKMCKMYAKSRELLPYAACCTEVLEIDGYYAILEKEKNKKGK